MAKKNPVVVGCLCALCCETLFGLSYVFTKFATQSASPFALLGWRFGIAAVVMVGCVLFGLMKVDLKGKPLKPLLVVTLLNPVIYFVAETVGISRITASESGTFLACIPVMSLLMSTLILKKKPSRNQVIGIFITLAGVLVTVFAAGAAASLNLVGYLMLLLAVVCYALYSVYVEKASDYTEAEITFFMMIGGGITFVILAVAEALTTGSLRTLVTLPLHNTGFLVAVVYQGVCCSVLAFFLSNAAIARIGVNRTSSFIGIATVVSILVGVLFLHEAFSLVQILGAAIILAGVYFANRN